MTDDQLTHLLTSATDLTSSEALHRRVSVAVASSARPVSRLASWGRLRLGFAVSGSLGAAAILAIALMPRASSAEGLLRQAAENQARVGARFTVEYFGRGAWHPGATGLLAPGWSRREDADGGLTLQTPETRFERIARGEAVFRVPSNEHREDDDPRLASRLRMMERSGWNPIVSKREARQKDGRTLQDVTILLRTIDQRETLTLDAKTELPVAILQERRDGSGWTPTMRVTFRSPGPAAGTPEFWAGIDRRKIVDSAELAHLWEHRLTPVLRRLDLADGRSIAVRDLRALPTGDVLMLYTGPVDLGARLVGREGTAYVRVPFSPNAGHMIPRSRPMLKIGGEIVRGLWFAPEREGDPGETRVRLEFLNAAGNSEGRFDLQPIHEPASLPRWADAIDFQLLALDPEGCVDEARMVAAYDRWLDPQGRSVLGIYRLAPKGNQWISETPRPGLRRDPAAAAAAAVAFRRMMARAESRGNGINPDLVEQYLGRFDREARLRR